MSETRTIPLAKFLEAKSVKDNCNYDYSVTAGESTGLQLNVYHMDDERKLLFTKPVISEKTIRSSDVFHVESNKAVYTLGFFM